jgi:hypothetical protein
MFIAMKNTIQAISVLSMLLGTSETEKTASNFFMSSFLLINFSLHRIVRELLFIIMVEKEYYYSSIMQFSTANSILVLAKAFLFAIAIEPLITILLLR